MTTLTQAPRPPLAHDDVEALRVVGFAPLLASTGALASATAMCALFFITQCLVLVVTRLLAPLLPERAHVLLALLVGTLCTGVLWQAMLWQHYGLTQSLGIYLPLLAVNATIYLTTLRAVAAPSLIRALRVALPGVLVMCALTLIIALLRHALGDHFAALSTPFGVLLVFAALLALVRFCRTRPIKTPTEQA